jgi:hypothetical protein
MLKALSKRWPLSKGQAILNYLFFAPVALDVIEIFGRIYFPNTLLRITCRGLPIASIAQFFVPSRLVEFATKQCEQPMVGEPVFSIIFFVFKIALMFVVGGYAIVNATVHFQEIQELPEIKSKKKTPLEHLKGASALCFGLGLFCWYLFLQFDVEPARFGTNLLAKISEDFYALMLLCSLGLLVSTPINMIQHMLSSSTKGSED